MISIVFVLFTVVLMVDSQLMVILTESKSLNWWIDVPETTKLVAIETKANGNCLLNAARIAIDSIRDTDLHLRHELHSFIKSDKHNSNLYKIWRIYELEAQKQPNISLSKEQWVREWRKLVIDASPDLISENQCAQLGKIHIFALANMLKTAIIVMTTECSIRPIHHNDICGIYLPYLFPAEQRRPIFIAYSERHFSTLLPDILNDIDNNQIYHVPIVDSSRELLDIQFVEPNSNSAMKLSVLKQYFCIEEKNGIICVCWSKMRDSNTAKIQWPTLPAVPAVPAGPAVNKRKNEATADNKTAAKDFREIRNNIMIAKVPKSTERHSCSCKQTENCGDRCHNRLSMVECNPKKCQCGHSCKNMAIQNGTMIPLEVFETSKGFGIKSSQEIKKGEFVIEYIGEIISEDQFKERLETMYTGQTHHYGMYLQKGFIIDATQRGNKSRYINHSCSPNCEVEKWLVNGFPRMAIYARTDIPPNEEITYDYHFKPFGGGKHQMCKCLSLDCRGSIDV